jgi:hypothetical protein
MARAALWWTAAVVALFAPSECREGTVSPKAMLVIALRGIYPHVRILYISIQQLLMLEGRIQALASPCGH